MGSWKFTNVAKCMNLPKLTSQMKFHQALWQNYSRTGKIVVYLELLTYSIRLCLFVVVVFLLEWRKSVIKRKWYTCIKNKRICFQNWMNNIDHLARKPHQVDEREINEKFGKSDKSEIFCQPCSNNYSNKSSITCLERFWEVKKCGKNGKIDYSCQSNEVLSSLFTKLLK